MSAVTICSVPLYEFSENLPANRCEVQQCSLLLWQAWHFFNSRQGYASSGVYNINGVLRSSFEFLIGFRTLFEFWIGFGTGRDVSTHNLTSKPHSVPPYTPYTTELVVAGLKQYRIDQCGLARKVLSVRHRRPRFARPPIGVRRDRLSVRTLRYVTTHN